MLLIPCRVHPYSVAAFSKTFVISQPAASGLVAKAMVPQKPRSRVRDLCMTAPHAGACLRPVGLGP
jgi:hypothetical protein